MKKMLFIFNPHSGRGLIKNNLMDIIDIFVKGGYLVTAYPTQDKLDAFNTVKEHSHAYSLVVCSGGDGTLNETVKGMMECKVRRRIGYIPTGTTNDFASSLGISKNMLTAAKTVLSGEDYACDIGSFNDNYFTYICAFGLFTEVSYQTPQHFKNMLGQLAYVLESIKHLTNIKTYHMVVEHDGESFEDDFVFGMVSNSMSVGGFKGTDGLGVVLNDGFFEVGLIKMPNNALELQQTLNDLLKLEINSNYIYFLRASEVTITCAEEVAWTLDGEFGGIAKAAVIQNHNKALTFIRERTTTVKVKE